MLNFFYLEVRKLEKKYNVLLVIIETKLHSEIYYSVGECIKLDVPVPHRLQRCLFVLRVEHALNWLRKSCHRYYVCICKL